MINSSSPPQAGEPTWWAVTAVPNEAVVAHPQAGHPYNGMLAGFPASSISKPPLPQVSVSDAPGETIDEAPLSRSVPRVGATCLRR